MTDAELELEQIRDVDGVARALLVKWQRGQTHALVERRTLMQLIVDANADVLVIEQAAP